MPCFFYKKKVMRLDVLIKRFSLYVLIILSSSCLSSKKVSDKNSETKEKESTSVIGQTTEEVKTNGEIKDRIIINVPESDNKELLAMFDSAMKQMNTSKISGTNSYTSRYDEETRQLVIDFIIAQTQDKIKDSSVDTKSEKSFEQQTDEYFSSKISNIPWWFWLILFLWFLPQIISRVKLIISPVQLLLNKQT